MTILLSALIGMALGLTLFHFFGQPVVVILGAAMFLLVCYGVWCDVTRDRRIAWPRWFAWKRLRGWHG